MQSAKDGQFKYCQLMGLACLLFLSVGCTMCAECDLDSYNAYGGRWQRTNREAGRVGSIYDPAGAMVPYGPEDANNPNSVLAPSNSDEKLERTEAGDEEDNDIENGGIDFDFGSRSQNMQETSIRSPYNF